MNEQKGNNNNFQEKGSKHADNSTKQETNFYSKKERRARKQPEACNHHHAVIREQQKGGRRDHTYIIIVGILLLVVSLFQITTVYSLKREMNQFAANRLDVVQKIEAKIDANTDKIILASIEQHNKVKIDIKETVWDRFDTHETNSASARKDVITSMQESNRYYSDGLIIAVKDHSARILHSLEDLHPEKK